MKILIITIIAITLFITNIINEIVLVCSIVGSIILSIICVVLYYKYGFLKFYYHDLLGWHTPDNSSRSYDGCSTHATCKFCKKDIMQDSQGNWF